MTHDELLAKIDYYLRPTIEMTGDDKIKNSALGFMKALCAVVELHKPEPLDERGDVCLTCCPDLLTLYPCPTIKAIVKELQ